MAATYQVLISDELLSTPLPWPRNLHPGQKARSEWYPGSWLVDITDDDAPEELNGKLVDLIFTRRETGEVEVTGREPVSLR